MYELSSCVSHTVPLNLPCLLETIWRNVQKLLRKFCRFPFNWLPKQAWGVSKTARQLCYQYLQCAVKPKQAVNRVWKLRITSSASCDVTNRQMMNSNLISGWHCTEDNKSLTQWTKELWRKCTYEGFLEIFHPQKPKNHSHIVPSPLLAHCCSRRTLASTPFCISTFLNGASRRLWPSKLPLHVTRFLSLSLARPDIYRHRLFHFSYDRG